MVKPLVSLLRANDERKLALLSLSQVERKTHDSPGNGDHALISICTTLEIYVDSALQRLIAASTIEESRFGRALLAHLEDQFGQSWTTRLRWLSNGFEISLAGTEVDGDRATIVEARNAIVHGGGMLTARQTRDVREALDLQRRLRERMGADLNGHSLVIGGRAVRWSLGIARAYIRTLAERVRDEELRLMNWN